MGLVPDQACENERLYDEMDIERWREFKNSERYRPYLWATAADHGGTFGMEFNILVKHLIE
jgi:hypothetical protein